MAQLYTLPTQRYAGELIVELDPTLAWQSILTELPVIHATDGTAWLDLARLPLAGGGTENRALSVEASDGGDEPVARLNATLQMRTDAGGSLSPDAVLDAINRLPGTVSPAIYGGRRILWQEPLGSPTSTDPADWKPIFWGHLMDPRVSSNGSLQLFAVDAGARLQIPYTGDPVWLGTEGQSIPLDEAIQLGLDALFGPGEVRLKSPGDVEWAVPAFQMGAVPNFLEFAREAAQQRGLALRWWYDEGTQRFQLELFQLQQDKPAPEFTFTPGQTTDITAHGSDVASYRNDFRLRYLDSATGQVETIHRPATAGERAAFGLKPLGITEASTSLIDTAPEAESFLDTVEAALRQPAVVGTRVLHVWEPDIQINSRVQFTADGRVLQAPLDGYVIRWTKRKSISGTNAQRSVTIEYRAAPVGQIKAWLRSFAKATVERDPLNLPYFSGLHQSPGDDTLHVDLSVEVEDAEGRRGVLRAWLNADSPDGADPSADPDGEIEITALPATVGAADEWDLTGGGTGALFDGVRTHPAHGKEIYLEYVTASGVSTGKVRFLIRPTGGVVDEGDNLLPGIIDSHDLFASGYSPVRIAADQAAMDALPLAAQVAVMGGKLYRRDEEGDWTAAVPVVDLVGDIVANTVAEGSITTAHFAQGIEPVHIETGPELPTSRITSLVLFEGKLYQWNSVEGAYEEYVAAVGSTTIVNTENIANAAVTAAKIGAQAVTTAKLALGAVTAAIIAAGAITTETIGEEAVTAAKIGAQAVTTAKIAEEAVTSALIAAGAVGNQHLVDGSVSATKFASGLRPVEVVSSLPSSGNTIGRTVVLTTDGKLYRYTASGWSSAVPAVDITGTLQGSQIAAAAIGATQLADGSITITKYASGTRPVEIGSAFPTTGNVEGRLFYRTTDNKLYRYTGTAWTAEVPTTDLTGTIQSAQIAAAAVTAEKIGNAAVETAKIATGAVTAALLASGAVTAEKIAGGAVTTAKFATGLRPIEVVSALPSSGNVIGRTVILTTDGKLYRYTASGWTASVPTVDLTGTISSAQIADAAITAAKIGAAAVEAGNLAAGAIYPRHMVAGGVGMALNTDPLMIDLGAWDLVGYWSVESVSQAPAGDSAMMIEETTGTASRSIFSPPMPIDPGRTYRVSLNAVQTNGDGRNYLTVDFLDVNGDSIQGTLSDATGWRHKGTYHYFGVNNEVIPPGPNWTRYEFSFGVKGEGTIPSGAKSARIGALVVRQQTTPLSRLYLQDFRLEEVIDSTLIADDSISTPKLVALSITAGKIAAGAIETEKLAANAVTAAKIAAHTITAAEIAAGAITAAEIAANSITAAQIAANAITASELAAGSVQAEHITANAVTAGKIAANAVTTGTIAAGAVTAAEIAAGAITSEKLEVGSRPLPLNNYSLTGTLDGWYRHTGTSDLSQVAEIPRGGTTVLAHQVRSDGNVAYASSQFEVDPNRTYEVRISQALHPTNNNPGGTWYVGIYVYDASGTMLSVTPFSLANRAFGGETNNFYFLSTSSHNTPGEWYDVVGYLLATDIADPDVVPVGQMANQHARLPANARYVRLRYLNWNNAGATRSRFYYSPSVAPVGASIIHGDTIQTGTLAADRIQANSITAAQLAADSVTASELSAGSVQAIHITAGAITAEKIDTGAVTAAAVSAGAITAGKIAAAAITTDKIEALAITGEKIAANAITAVKIAADAITTGKIAAGAVTATELAANAVTAQKILAGAITAPKIAAGAVTADALAANAVTAGTIAAGAVGAAEIAAGAITADKLLVGTSPNLIPNGDFRTGDTSGWNPWSNPASIDVVSREATAVTSGAPSPFVLRFARTTTSGVSAFSHTQPYNQQPDGVRVSGGEQYRISVAFAEEAGASATQQVIVYAYRNGGTVTSLHSSGALAGSTSWQTYTATVTMPADALKFHVYLYSPSQTGTIYWADVRAEKLVPGVLIENGAVTAQKIAANTITAAQILAGAISATELATGAVTAAKIEAGAVTTAKIAAGAVTADRIASNSITAVQIAANAITASELAANSVTATHIVAGTITAVEIAAGAINATHLASGSVTTGALQAVSVTTDKIAANAITAVKIAANQITAEHIAANSLTAGVIAAGAIGVSEIAAGAVNADKLAAGAVTADKITANAVTSTKIASDAVTAAKIASNAITSDKIDANAVTAAKIAAGSIGADHIAANAITAGKLAIGWTQGSTLNNDPLLTDIAAWETVAGSGGITSTGAAGSVGPNALTSNTSGGAWHVFSRAVPVERTKTYRVSGYGRAQFGNPGNGNFYLVVRLLDSAGANISGAGTYWMYPAAGVTLGTSFTFFQGVFGADTANPFPSNATHMQVGVLLNYGGTTGAYQAQGLRLEEVLPGVLIKDGAITAQKINVSDLSAINATFSGDVKLYNDQNLLEAYVGGSLAATLRPDTFTIAAIPTGNLNLGGVQLAHTSGVAVGVYEDGVARVTGGGMAIEESLSVGDSLNVQGGSSIFPGVYTTFEAHQGDPALNQASISIRANLGGTLGIRRVVVGPPDSAGSGYRWLRIAN